MPDRGDQSDDNLQALSRDGYLTEVVIPHRSPLCEVTPHEIRSQDADRLLSRCSRQELLCT